MGFTGKGQRLKYSSFLVLGLLMTLVVSNAPPKFSLPKKNVEIEVFKTPVKTELDLTPVTDYYSIDKTEIKVTP
jgi:hypothetical protein